jgi:hypothetical protein
MRPPTYQIIATALLVAILAGLVVAIVLLTIPDGGPPALH